MQWYTSIYDGVASICGDDHDLGYEFFQSFCCFELSWDWLGFEFNYGDFGLIDVSAVFVRFSHVGLVIVIVMLKLA